MKKYDGNNKMDLPEIYASYAQKVVEDMDIESLMNAVKEDIEIRLDDLPDCEAMDEIRESVYAEDILVNVTSP